MIIALRASHGDGVICNAVAAVVVLCFQLHAAGIRAGVDGDRTAVVEINLAINIQEFVAGDGQLAQVAAKITIIDVVFNRSRRPCRLDRQMRGVLRDEQLLITSIKVHVFQAQVEHCAAEVESVADRDCIFEAALQHERRTIVHADHIQVAVGHTGVLTEDHRFYSECTAKIDPAVVGILRRVKSPEGADNLEVHFFLGQDILAANARQDIDGRVFAVKDTYRLDIRDGRGLCILTLGHEHQLISASATVDDCGMQQLGATEENDVITGAWVAIYSERTLGELITKRKARREHNPAVLLWRQDHTAHRDNVLSLQKIEKLVEAQLLIGTSAADVDGV